MTAKSLRTLLAAIALALSASALRAQVSYVRAEGRVTSAGKRVPDAQVVLISQGTFKTWKAKTDRDGAFSVASIYPGRYTIEVFNAAGDILYRKNQQLDADSDAAIHLDIQLFSSETPSAAPPPRAETAEPPEPSKPQNPDSGSVNALISQYNSALAAKDWPAAITALKAIVAADPTRWDFFEALGNVQMTTGDYEGAAESFEKGARVAQQTIANDSSNGSKLLQSDRDRAKSGLAQMLTNEGNAYLKLKKNKEAIAAYSKAAELSPNPAIAYFNLCVTYYNAANVEGATDACDKAIAANPDRADTYFIKGALLISASKRDKDGKVTPPPGAIEALKKYLQLAPQGAHAADVRQMLDYVSAKPQASGKKP